MTKVKFSTDLSAGTITMTLDGHAEHENVCAAISAVAFACGSCIEYMFYEDKLIEEPTLEADTPGHMEIKCKPKSEYFGEALHVYFVCQVGMHCIESEHSSDIQLHLFDIVPIEDNSK